MDVRRPTRAANEGTRKSMRSNKGRDTRPELAIRRRVHASGLRYRVSARPLPGFRRTADLVFTRLRVAVFVDGCFWHGCRDHGTRPRSNSDWWQTKIEANIARDRDTELMLARLGWNVVRVWEHESPDLAAERVVDALLSRG